MQGASTNPEHYGAFMAIHEAAGTFLAPAPRKNLPNRILRAFDAAKHILGLKRGPADALAEICRFVPQNRPFDTVFAHKATIAQRIGMSERTLYRHLASLQQLALIEVAEQERKSRNGRFGVARIRLTKRAATLLGFIAAPEEEPMIAADDDGDALACQPCVTVENSAVENPLSAPVIHSLPSANLASRHTLSEPTSSKHQPPQRFENGLPVDLSWLTSNGLSRAGIFKLMGIAKTHHKRLSDIVTVVHDCIAGIKGAHLYAYLAKLICGPTDFAIGAATERQRRETVKHERALARKAAVFRERFKGVALTNALQSRLYLIDDRCAFVQVFGGAYPTTAPLTDVKEWIERLEDGRLVLATLATEQRLMA